MTLNEIKSEISNNDIVLFMKGTPTFPQCGFSAQVISILAAEGVPYTTHDVLSDDELRINIKEYSNWPTIPQLYIRGEFIGGADIVHEMYDSGELSRVLQQQGYGF
jgi:monothiol glutaredoxin